MRGKSRPEVLAVTAIAVLAVAMNTRAQAPPEPNGAAPDLGKTAAAPVRPAILNQEIASVNGEKITRGELYDFLSRYQIPPDNHEQVYRDAVDTLVNTHLVTQYLDRLNLPVSETDVDRGVQDLEQDLKREGKSLAQALLESGRSLAEVRKEFATRIRWVNHVKRMGTDATLKKFRDSHKDLLSGTTVRASHILLKVDPKATEAEKRQVREKLLEIKKAIDAKKYTFAQAANKFSEDPSNQDGAGGDIGHFGLNSGIVEEFGKAAFALKVGAISDPVETPYGYHLIMVTDRKEGPTVDLERQRPAIINAYASELQKKILMDQRNNAKIVVKPMPKDLFPAEPPATEPAGESKGAATKGATPKR